MRILFLQNDEIKKDSYADIISKLLTTFFEESDYSFFYAKTLSDAKQIQLKDNSVITMEEPKGLSLFRNLQLKSLLKKQSIDWLIQTGINEAAPVSVKQLLVPSSFEKVSVPEACFSCIQITVPSLHVRQQIIKQTTLPDNTLPVLPFIATDLFQPISWSEKQSVKMRYAQGQEYFLALGKGKTLDSFTALLKSFSGFKKWQHSGMKLIVLGQLSFSGLSEWKEKFSTYRYRDDVVLIEDINAETFARLMAGSYVFIHTPTNDTDVLPLLQAMKSETPGLSFHTKTGEETAGSSAIFIEEKDYDELAQKMILLYKDEALRSRLIEGCTSECAAYTKTALFTHFQNIFALPA